MTYEQTLERIEKQKKAIDGYPVKVREDYENVKEALKKQIPKSPFREDGLMICPVCKRVPFGSYCAMCGQRLDWSEDDE